MKKREVKSGKEKKIRKREKITCYTVEIFFNR